MMRDCLAVAMLGLVGLGGSASARAAENPGTIRHVVFLIADDLRAGAMGCYGDATVATPHLDRLARRGVVFDRAYCQGVYCLPSRDSLMHGRYLDRHNVNLGEALRGHDVHTARVGKIYHMRVPGDIIAGTDGNDIASTWDEVHNSPGMEAHTPGDYACLSLGDFTREAVGRQTTRMPQRPFVTVRSDGDGSRQPDHRTADRGIEVLGRLSGQRSFVALGFVRPHYPMVAPESYFHRYPHDAMRLPATIPGDLADIPAAGITGTRNDRNPIGDSVENQRRMWSGYYAAIEFMDFQVGRVIAEIDRLGIAEETAIIFTSDHGYHLGDHGLWQKKNLHEQVIRVPLIIAAPGIKPGRSDSLVELVDLYPTVLAWFGVPKPGATQGISLQPILDDPDAMIRDAALAWDGRRGRRHFVIRDRRYAYMRYHGGERELYDMATDPGQFHNLADQATHEPVRRRLDGQLEQKIRRFELR